MWSRVRHRRLQALSLVALAGLLTVSVGLGPLYQRAMEQALAGSVLQNASPDQKALRVTAQGRSVDSVLSSLPERLEPFVEDPIASVVTPVSVPTPDGPSVATRLYAVGGACARLEVVQGECPSTSGQVMVSTDDVEVNGWTVGSTVKLTERLDPGNNPELSKARVTIVGVYAPSQDQTWLGAPLSGRAGIEIQDVGVATDDWVTAPQTMDPATALATWHRLTVSVVWSLDTGAIDHDDLLRIGPVVADVQRQALADHSGAQTLVTTDIPALAEEVATGSDQGRTTVVVLVAQLLVLVAVVLWMVLVAATDDRRPELALARLRGRGRRGAAGYLLAELLPLTLCGGAAGILAAPLVMAGVARLVFPVTVPVEIPGAFLLAALGSLAAVLLVVLAAARRAAREPVDSLLRAVPARQAGAGAGAAEVALVVFSLTAVVALVTGNLEGPLATLAPTLLALAAALLLGRALAPATRLVSKRLLRSGRAVAAAGIVGAVRRPAARRVLVMVVVASALFVFCLDALVTGQHNRQNAAEQANGAPYVMAVQATRLDEVVAALEEVDPEHRHLTPVVSTSSASSVEGPTIAVDAAAFPRLAYLPAGTDPDAWAAIAAPRVDPLRLNGTTLAGSVVSSAVRLLGPSKDRTDDLTIGLRLLEPGGVTGSVELSVIPLGDQTVPFSVSVPCAEGCIVTGLAVSTPPASRVAGTVLLPGLAVDGQPFSLGPPTAWRRAVGAGGSLVPAADPAGELGANITTSGSAPPVMASVWVPEPVPALVTTAEEETFTAAGLENPITMSVAGTLARVPGSPPGSRVVDVAGLLRRPDTNVVSDVVSVWSDDRAAMDRARRALGHRAVVVGEVTTVEQVRTRLDASPAAWSLALSVLVGGAALLVAMLVMLVATATTWRARADDLAALRMAGLPDRSLRRMELLGQLPVVVVGAVAGAACGTVAAVLALPGVRQFTAEPAVDTSDFSTPWAVVLVASVLALALLAALGLATARWTARQARLARIREVV